jgi:hypothetical protein
VNRITVVAEQPLGCSLHIEEMIDIGGNAAEYPGQELNDQGTFQSLLLEMVIENVEVTDIIALELHKDVVVGQDIDHSIDFRERILRDD